MTDPAIIAAFIGAIVVVAVALGGIIFRFGKLSAQVEALRHDQTRRHDAVQHQSRERYEGIISRLTRLETYFMTGSVGDDD